MFKNMNAGLICGLQIHMVYNHPYMPHILTKKKNYLKNLHTYNSSKKTDKI